MNSRLQVPGPYLTKWDCGNTRYAQESLLSDLLYGIYFYLLRGIDLTELMSVQTDHMNDFVYFTIHNY